MIGEENNVTKERFEALGQVYTDIGIEGAAIVGGDPDGLFIYIEVQDYSVYGAVFKDEGEQVRFFSPGDILFELALDAWEAVPEDQRWLVMEYDVKGRAFNVNFVYPEEVNPEEDASDRRQAALDRRYGDKPVIYPPIPDHFQELD